MECPICGNGVFRKDNKHNETYCVSCGLVVKASVPYVGVEIVNVENIKGWSEKEKDEVKENFFNSKKVLA